MDAQTIYEWIMDGHMELTFEDIASWKSEIKSGQYSKEVTDRLREMIEYGIRAMRERYGR